MDIEEFVSRYIDAWNRHDVADVLELMHPGAAYYDAFWMETCVGPDLAQYLRDNFEEEPYWYQQLGDVIEIDGGVVYRYSAHDRSEAEAGEPIYEGAEVLILRDERILTVTDQYCDPDPAALKEVAELAARRHGVPAHTVSGLSALKVARIRSDLSRKIERERIYLDPNITTVGLAEQIGCTVEQLSIVIERHFGASFASLLDSCRIEYARELLETEPNDAESMMRIAETVGFRSYPEFAEKFRDSLGVSPDEYCRQESRDVDPAKGL